MPDCCNFQSQCLWLWLECIHGNSHGMCTVTSLGRELCYLHITHRVLLAWCLLKFNLAYIPWRHVNVISRSPHWHNDTTRAPALSSILKLKLNNEAFSNTCYLEDNIKERRKRNPADVIKGMNLSMQRSPSVTVSILTVVNSLFVQLGTNCGSGVVVWHNLHVMSSYTCRVTLALRRTERFIGIGFKTRQQECVSRL